MQVYKGSSRRQVGGGLFSTIARGAKPLLLSLFARLKPHLVNASKAVGKRAIKAALNVGTDMASNIVSGRMNKRKAQDIIDSEITNLRSDAATALQGYKQHGSGKRRRIVKRKKMVKRKSINKRGPKRLRRKTYKTKKCTSKKACKSSKKDYKRKKKSTRRKSSKKRVFNKDIFGK